MAQAGEWTIIFYTSASGASPVREFLDSLDEVTRDRIEWAIEQLHLCNITARFPLVRHLGDKLWELRIESKTNIYRIFYIFFTGKQIVLLYGFSKKSQKTPRKELIIAQAYKTDYEQREGGKL